MTEGFLGTRADFLMDLVLVSLLITPVLLLLSFRWARAGHFDRHRLVQLGTLALVAIVVLTFEINIRLTGGTGAIPSGEAYLGAFWFFLFLYTHIAVATATFLGWITLAVYSSRKYKKELPGGFSKIHKKLGMAIFAGVVFTAVSGAGLYWLGFII